jgi:prepilin-type N-terminal cleavage/methylation domain-containing protein
MKNKGFTLVELLGVIVVLGIIALLAFPPIINQMRKMRNTISEGTLKIIYSAAEKYMEDNKDLYPQNEDVQYCISLQDLVDGGSLSEPVYDAQTGVELSLDKELYIDIGASFDKTYNLYDVGGCNYIDPSGAKAPDLLDNMIPITRVDNKWVKADLKQEWYNYNNQQWANAVLVTESSRSYYKRIAPGTEVLEADILMYLVWVPRFRYKLFNTSYVSVTSRQFEIIFEGKRTTKSNGTLDGTWVTHPAFTFNSVSLNGIWVNKFEISHADATNSTNAQVSAPQAFKARSKPNQYIWRNISLSDAFTVADDLNNNGNRYGISTSADTHLMKNKEWGAIAYLSYSKYGNPNPIWINPNSNFVTGCAGDEAEETGQPICRVYDSTNGLKASNTGNIYGIYDLVGAGQEMVMGAQYNSVSNANLSVGGTGFSQAELDSASMNKYVDKYAYGTTYNNQSAYDRSQIGDATGETRGWNSDRDYFVLNTNPWFLRGGITAGLSTAGVFAFTYHDGSRNQFNSFRAVIVKPN